MRRTLLPIIIALLLAGCTGGGSGPDLDTDDDGVEDSIEEQGKIIEVKLVNGTERRTVTADVGTYDTDGDGLSDGEEMNVRGTDPRDVDTDDDGLLDGKDTIAPDDDTRARWRAAGVIEVNGTFLGEFDACTAGGPQLKPNAASSDLPLPDELLDGEELRGWDVTVRGSTRHVTSDPCEPDTDRDGSLDHEEKVAGTDPRNPDTDSDGALDGTDADPLWDLSLEFRELNVTLVNSSAARIIILLGDGAAELRWPGNGTATLAVPDGTGDRGTLEAAMVLSAEDTQTGEPLGLFDDPRGVILIIDLIRGTVGGAETEGDLLTFSGRDGSVSMRWSTVRR